MGWNDHIYDNEDTIKTCKHCNRKYIQYTEEQIAGCRDKDYDYCPYCGNENGSSMNVEYHNRKINK